MIFLNTDTELHCVHCFVFLRFIVQDRFNFWVMINKYQEQFREFHGSNLFFLFEGWGW